MNLTDQALAYDAGTAIMNVTCYRKQPLDFIFDILGVALSGTFQAQVWVSRGSTTVLTTLQVSFTVETQTYQYWIDECVLTKDDIPCDQTATDTFPISTVTLAKEQSVIAALPQSQYFGGPTVLHWKLSEISPDPHVVVEGDFTILE